MLPYSFNGISFWRVGRVTQIWLREVLVKDGLDQWTVPQKIASSEPTEHER